MPREETQFKDGNPGGPGRPKGRKNFSTIVREILDTKHPDTDKTYIQVIAENLIKASENPNSKAAHELLQRIYPVLQKLAIEPVKIEIQIIGTDTPSDT